MTIKKIAQDQKGSLMVEFALSMVVLMPLLFGIADFCRLFYYSIEVANAAEAGADYGSQSVTNMTDTTGISTAAKNDAAEITSLNVTSSQVCQDDLGNTASCTDPSAYQYVKVTASYTFNTLLNVPMIPASVALSRTVMMRAQ